LASPAGQGKTIARTTIATAVSLTLLPMAAEAAADRAKFRLQLDDVISSEFNEVVESDFDGRLAMTGLIQSHPNPLYISLEERYAALPPFTHATEDVPEQYIVEATVGEKLTEGVRGIAEDASAFIPQISSYVRVDDVRDTGRSGPEGPDDSNGRHQTLLASVNPTFRYQKEQRKWHLTATYDYERGQYFHDRKATIQDHSLDVNWTRRLSRGSEFTVTSLYQDTHDRDTRDAIVDFNSNRDPDDLDYNRLLVNLNYRKGTKRDRSRYDVYYFKELSELDHTMSLDDSYELDRDGIGARYTWQARRQIALVAEAKYSDFDYNLAFRDNDHHRIVAGTDMILGRRIRANLRAGYEQKSFDIAGANDSHDDFVWEASIDWAMRRKTNLQLETGKEIFEFVGLRETESAEMFNVHKWVRAAWKERWSDKVNTSLSYTYRENEAALENYSDRAYQAVASVIYHVSDNLRFALDGAYTHESTAFGASSSRRTLTFSTNYSL
jgi:hypothetical protein